MFLTLRVDPTIVGTIGRDLETTSTDLGTASLTMRRPGEAARLAVSTRSCADERLDVPAHPGARTDLDEIIGSIQLG